jgi:PAS domain S-box-containing protein
VPEREIERLARLYGALTSVNHAIVWTRDRQELFRSVCAALVDKGGFSMAWIGLHDRDTSRLVPVARAGVESSYVDAVGVYVDDRPEGHGPSGTAFREARTVVTADIQSEPSAAPWREQLSRRGFHATAAMPIRDGGEVCGTLNVYATEARRFEEKEVALLEEVATEVSFALDNIAREADRARAHKVAENERVFSAAMIESMPGIVYFYDHTGRFLRWNRNFEVVSGYSSAEIAAMHPLDFFAGAERELIAARIGDVLAHGDSWAEAHFVSKDGMRTPYFFTGRRVTWEGIPCLVGMGMDISEKKRSELALRASEERFRSTVDGMVEGCQLLSFDWTYLYLNDAAALQNRRPNAELLGHTMPEMWPGIEQTEVFAMFRRTMTERVALHGETLFTFPDGTSRWFEVRCQPAPEGIFVMSIDVSDRKRAEMALLDANANLEKRVLERTVALDEARGYLDAIIDHLPNPVFYKDAGLRFLGVNRAYEQAFGVRREDVTGKTVLELDYLPDADRRRYQEEQIALLAGGTTIRREAAMPFADRHEHQTLYSVQAIIRADGSAGGVVGSIVDITALKESEAALARAMKAAEAADRLKSAFLATMSHELRTPLNSIIGFTGILLQGLAGPLNDEQTKQLGMVRGSARHLLELINDVLDISKIEAGQMTVRREPLELRPLLERALTVVKPLADRKHVELRLEADPALPRMVSDVRRLEQVLLNLVNNAVKFTERGTVTIAAAPVDARHVRVRVIDTGEGIRPEDQARLFQPFTQIDTGLTRRHEGTGLGLAICKRLATLLGGDISCESVFGEGSTFTVLLPTEPVPS